MLKQVCFVLWPSFMIAAGAEFVFFSVINPQELYFLGEPVSFPRIATYSIGFFCFWVLGAASSMLSLYLATSPDQVNNGRTSCSPFSSQRKRSDA